MLNDLSALDTALALLRRGLWPVALHPPGATIQTKDGPKVAKGKEPIGKAWGATRPTEASLRETFRKHPGAGVGLLLGPAGGVVDLEIDGPEGEASVLKLFDGKEVDTLGSSSRRGPHRFFAFDPRLAALGKAVVKLDALPGLEIRLGAEGEQLQSACPPTRGEDGEPRSWNECDSIAELPDSVIQYLTDAHSRPTPQPEPQRLVVPDHADGPAGAWFAKALKNEAGRVATARDGNRHEALLAAAKTLGGTLHHGYLSEPDVIAELSHAGRRAGLPDQEIAETIRDGIRYGTAAPLPWPDKLARPATRNGKPAKAREGDDWAEPRESQAEALLRLAGACSLSHTDDDRTFARVPVTDHHENHEIRSIGFKRWLIRAYYNEHGRPPSSDAMQGALGVLESRAQYDGPTEPVYVRVALGPDGVLFIDLCDDTWRAVRVGLGAWEIIDRPPVRFRRPKGLRALPAPVRGGTVNALRPFVNVSDADFRLLVAWLTAAIQPVGPYPPLVLSGEQGSAKSTLARVARELLDPHVSVLRCEPKEARDLMIGAINGWVVAYDNMSHVPAWLSDALCRLATGGGFSTRQLYTDSEEVFLDAQRPVILTGIDDFVRRGDLADRCIFLHLPAIPVDKRRTEASFWADFNEARPVIFGALLSAVAEGLRLRPEVRLSHLPRMADFAVWGEAVCRALGEKPGVFLEAYERNRHDANEAVLDDSLVAAAVRSFMANRSEWEGTNSELLDELNRLHPNPAAPKDRWPKSPRGLSGHIRRLAPALRAGGLEVAFDIDKERRLRLSSVKPGGGPSQPSTPSGEASGMLFSGDGRDGQPSPNRPQPSRANATPDALRDGRDGRDGPIPSLTGDGREPPDPSPKPEPWQARSAELQDEYRRITGGLPLTAEDIKEANEMARQEWEATR